MIANDELEKAPDTLTLKAIRINLGWSLEKASTEIGITPVTLSSYERGDTYPSLPIIMRILEVYNISFNRINFLLDNTALSDKKEV